MSGVHVLAPELVGQRLSDLLFDTFGRMLLLIGAGVVVALLLFFLDPMFPRLADFIGPDDRGSDICGIRRR